MKIFAFKAWIPRIKYGAGLPEFSPAEAGPGMTLQGKIESNEKNK